MGTSILRRVLCRLQLCHSFQGRADSAGVWSECRVCGKRSPHVSFDALRDYIEAEAHAEAVRQMTLSSVVSPSPAMPGSFEVGRRQAEAYGGATVATGLGRRVRGGISG